MDEQKFSKGRLGRFLRLGSLSTMVGASYLGQKVKSMVVSPEKASESLVKANIRNAERISKTFGELKGVIMKVGQMISLQTGIFPQEFTSILGSLQQDSPPVEFAVIEEQISRELGAGLPELFSSFDPEACASASIGQVHRAVLHEGRQVVVKVQYPGVEAMVESDLKNLRMVFRSIGQAKLDMDVMEIWDEIRERLFEELNYEHEFNNIMTFRDLFRDDPRILIPEPIPEYSTRRVLTMEDVPGLNWRDVVREDFPAEVRRNLATLLFETMLRQLFEFRILHADPNLSNFAFRRDERLVLYDFGCIKRFPKAFIDTYRQMVLSGLRQDYSAVLQHFRALGFSWTPDDAVTEEMVRHVAQIVLRPYLVEDGFNFGEATLHEEIFSFIRQNYRDDVKFVIPPDIIFLDRVVGGMYGNMMNLKAVGNWRDRLTRYLTGTA